MGNNYKDSLFRSLFADNEALRELYNTLTGTHYDETAEIVINTLSETLFTMQKKRHIIHHKRQTDCADRASINY
jgi:hypothetical protein